MTIFIYNKAGQVVSHSKNLRGIIDHNRKNSAARVEVFATTDGSGTLSVRWANGDWANTLFQSYNLAVSFAQNKRFASAEKHILPRQIL